MRRQKRDGGAKRSGGSGPLTQLFASQRHCHPARQQLPLQGLLHEHTYASNLAVGRASRAGGQHRWGGERCHDNWPKFLLTEKKNFKNVCAKYAHIPIEVNKEEKLRLFFSVRCCWPTFTKEHTFTPLQHLRRRTLSKTYCLHT